MGRPVYLDCDTGIDDSMAIAYLMAHPGVDLVGVGTVFGNIDAHRAARNTLDLLALGGHDHVPVAVGAEKLLAGAWPGGAAHVHGDNGIGGVDLPHCGREPVSSAADLLIRLAHEHEGDLRVLAIGPLTNLARAVDREPALPSLVESVVVMGGAAKSPGNVTPVAEANIFNDPQAAARVLDAGWPLTLVPLDLTLENTLEESDRAVLLGAAQPVPRAVGAMLDVYFSFYTGTYGRRCAALHDPLAAAIAAGGVTPTLAPAVQIVVDETDGPGRGQTICDLRGERVGYPAQPTARNRLVLEISAPFAPHLMEVLTSR
ncbi:nucleoside hydrolase [Cryptosporangium phraense]|uniref:Nucleoside hydrolase n=1 Tax=Cryptosporangium phraense TaxID=2593070 RepID=A0A545B003_9ACTN|nr:nucleoside hydrolase [Cryptosporangium phraense]TQS46910.1 nucleoside hydrolase [Cryptosporangium phraense]